MDLTAKSTQKPLPGAREIDGIVLFVAIVMSLGTAIAMTVGLTGHWIVLCSMSLASMGFIGVASAIRWGYAKLVQAISLRTRQSDGHHLSTAL